MHTYRVLKRGVMDGIVYDPRGKRPFMTRHKPIPEKKMPSWLEPVTKEEQEAINKSKEDDFVKEVKTSAKAQKKDTSPGSKAAKATPSKSKKGKNAPDFSTPTQGKEAGAESIEL